MRLRRRVLAVVVLMALGAWALRSVPLWSRALLARGLSSFFDRPTTVERVRYTLWPFAVEVRGIRVAGPTPQDEPFLEVPRLVAVPALRPLWDRRAVFSRLRIERPVLRVRAYKDGGDDIPRLRPKSGGAPLEVRIGLLVIERGEVVLDHQRVPLHLTLPGFRGRLEEGSGRALAGTLAFGPGEVLFGDAAPLPISTEIELELAGTTIDVKSAHLRSQGTDLTYYGRVELAPQPQGDLFVSGPIDLGVLDRHLIRSGFGMQGAARFAGSVSLAGSRINLKGRLSGTAGTFDAVAVPRFDGEVAWDDRGVHLRGLDLAALDGRGQVNVEIPPKAGVTRLSARVEDMDAEGLLQAVFDTGRAGLGARATGDLDLEWPRGRTAALSGVMAVDLGATADGRTPLNGRFEWRAEDGVQWIETADLRTPDTSVRLGGRIDRDRRTALEVELSSSDLGSADELGVRIRRALGAAEPQPLTIGGSGVFRGRWVGTLAEPVYEGRFTGDAIRYLGVAWGHAEWAGSSSAREVRSHSLVLRRDASELWLDGRLETGLPGEQDAVDLAVRLTNWPAADLATALGWDLSVTGPLSGRARIEGRRSAPQGEVSLTAAAGRYAGVPFADAEVAARLRGTATEITTGRARVGGGRVDFRGTLGAEGAYDGVLAAEDVELSELFPDLAPEARWGGRVTGRATVSGLPARPRLEGTLTSARLFLGDEGVGALEARVRGEGDGRLAIDATCRSARVDVAVSGGVAAAPPYASDLQVRMRETSIDPFVRVLQPRWPAVVGLVASGEARVTGPLADPRALTATAQLPDVQFLLPEYPVRNREPMQASLQDGTLTLAGLRLSGEGTDLEVGGSLAFVGGDGPLALRLRGAADLRALSFLFRELRGRGAAQVAMTVSGTRRAPVLDGTLEVDGGAVRVRGFPHGIEGVKGRVRFTQQGADLEEMTGTVGGGPVSATGRAAFAAGVLQSFDVEASGRDLSLRYPEGLRSRIDANLRYFGDPDQQWLTGDVDVKQALWTKRYDVASELLSEGRTFEENATLGGGLRYDLRVRAPGSLRVDNNLAALSARADLRLTGNQGAPIVLGRAEVDRGRVYFQGNTYVIRRGTIDFANPRKIDPLFDLEAETRISSFRITLKINGTLERVYPTLTSDPPLDAVGILSLLAGADPNTVLSFDAASRSAAQTRLAATGAATLAAGRLSEEVGLERGAEKLLGLNRFSIDPGLNRFSVDPSATRGNIGTTARLTVGKRLTPDVNVLYSVDLGGTAERLISLEYTLSDRFSLLMTRADPAGFGFDLRLRRSR
ncbi:MAG: translocation/assembly module TamB domain-containing protein [Vicinamibacteria bacterium]